MKCTVIDVLTSLLFEVDCDEELVYSMGYIVYQPRKMSGTMRMQMLAMRRTGTTSKPKTRLAMHQRSDRQMRRYGNAEIWRQTSTAMRQHNQPDDPEIQQTNNAMMQQCG